MSLIDGIGDEVVQFGIAVVVVLVAVLAWLSTNARPDRYRTVLVMRSRGQHPVTVRSRGHHPVTVNIQNRQGTRSSRARNAVAETPAINLSESRQVGASESNQSNGRVIPLQEMDSIVDADMAMLDNHRLHFYRRVEGPSAAAVHMEESGSTSDASESHEERDAEPVTSDQMREMDSIVSAMEADIDSTNTASGNGVIASDATDNATAPPNQIKTTSHNESSNDVAATTAAQATGPELSTQRKILIKLKYINDTLKEVEGSLDEPLKDFKCRHFSAELSSESRVRLIFNGRVLLDDGATLRACGLHHRAVVHCLVQPRRAAQPMPQLEPEPRRGHGHGHVHEYVTATFHPERYWDLENVLMTLVTLALTILWFFRCEYSNMFTASASVALFGLTVFYSVAIFGLYLSDTFHFERRPAPQPTPTN